MGGRKGEAQRRVRSRSRRRRRRISWERDGRRFIMIVDMLGETVTDHATILRELATQLEQSRLMRKSLYVSVNPRRSFRIAFRCIRTCASPLLP